MASKLGTIDDKTVGRLITEENVYIDSSKMDSLVTSIKNNEKAMVNACKTLATKTNNVVKKGYCAGVHKTKLTKFSKSANAVAKKSDAARAQLSKAVDASVKAYLVNLLNSAKTWEEALPALSALFSR